MSCVSEKMNRKRRTESEELTKVFKGNPGTWQNTTKKITLRLTPSRGLYKKCENILTTVEKKRMASYWHLKRMTHNKTCFFRKRESHSYHWLKDVYRNLQAVESKKKVFRTQKYLENDYCDIYQRRNRREKKGSLRRR